MTNYSIGGIRMHVKEIMYGGSNTPMTFILPFNDNPTTSFFNMKQVGTTFTVKCYIRLVDIGLISTFTPGKLFSLMTSTTAVDFITPDETIPVIINNIRISNVPEKFFVSLSDYSGVQECNDVELSLTKAVSL
jgi:hypothetical protein